jgi:AcrR family transcriptional regulator
MPRDKKDPADRREEILVATLDLIIASGVERLRATDVAERLGVSSGLIFYHFDTIENLIVRAFEFAAERDLARLDAVLATADGTIESRLRTVLREYGPTGRLPGGDCGSVLVEPA